MAAVEAAAAEAEPTPAVDQPSSAERRRKFPSLYFWKDMEANLRAMPQLRVVRVKRKRYTNSLSGAAAASRVLAFMHGHSMERFRTATRENAVKICEMLVTQRTLLPLKNSTKGFVDSARTFYRLAPPEGEEENAAPAAEEEPQSAPRRTSKPFFGRLAMRAAGKRTRDTSVLSGQSVNEELHADADADGSSSQGELQAKRAPRDTTMAGSMEPSQSPASSPSRTSRALRGLARMGSQALRSPLRPGSFRRQTAKKRREASSPAPGVHTGEQTAGQGEASTPKAKRRPPPRCDTVGENADAAPGEAGNCTEAGEHPAKEAPRSRLLDFGAAPAAGGLSLFEAGAAMWQSAMAAINRAPGAPLFNFGFGSAPAPLSADAAAPEASKSASDSASDAPAPSGRSATGLSMGALASLAVKSLTSPLRTGPEPIRPAGSEVSQGMAHLAGAKRVTTFGATTFTTTADAPMHCSKRSASSTGDSLEPQPLTSSADVVGLARAPRSGGAVALRRTVVRATRQRKRQQHTTVRRRIRGRTAVEPAPADAPGLQRNQQEQPCSEPHRSAPRTSFEEEQRLETKSLTTAPHAAGGELAALDQVVPRARCSTMAPGCRAFPSPLRHAMQAANKTAPQRSSMACATSASPHQERPTTGQAGDRWAVPALRRSLRCGRTAEGESRDARLTEYLLKRHALHSLAEGLDTTVESLVVQARNATQRGTLRIVRTDTELVSGLYPRRIDEARPVPSWVRDTCQRIEECEIDKLEFHSLTVVPNRWACKRTWHY